MEEGTILTWLKSVGDEVAVGEELVEIETDKANMAYEADVAGTLTEIVAEEGATLPIGEVIARIGDDGDSGGGDGEAAQAAEAPEAEQGGDEEPAAPPAPAELESKESPAAAIGTSNGGGSSGGERIKASPVARRLAKEKGIELSGIQGSGPSGRIVKADVERAESAGPATSTRQVEVAGPAPTTQVEGETAKGQTEVQELSKLQQVVARRMAESKATAPHFYLSAEIDMSEAVA
ncbi:MAG TPA: E3 binding domain-containing protein, partial [Solirubrobacterales bacterium]|nr:E3 binding domain-containing protein [Solirubrobacterales bacterium]